MGTDRMTIEAGGEFFALDAGRAVIWPRRGTVIVSDLHLGKSEALAAEGVPMPAGVLEHDLERLGLLVRGSGAGRVLVIGDLLHARSGLVPGMIERVARWREWLGVRWELVPGNHDRGIERVAGAWSLEIRPPGLVEDGIGFMHDPAEAGALLAAGARFVWCGHVHPAVRIRGNGDALRLACFHVAGQVGVLPAFSRFTGGVSPKSIDPGDGVYAIAQGRVIDVSGMVSVPRARPGAGRATREEPGPAPRVRPLGGPGHGRGTRRGC